MPDPAREVKTTSVSIEGMDEVFELSETPGTESGIIEQLAGASETNDPGQPGQDTIEASGVLTFVSTAEAAKLARVDSRTIRRWHEQKKVRGQFTKGKLLIVQEDLLSVAEEADLFTSRTPGTESGTTEQAAGTPETNDPGQPGQSSDIPQTPAVVFSDFLDRIERLSRENGELKAMLDEQRRENQELKLLTDSQHKRGFWTRFYGWFIGARS